MYDDNSLQILKVESLPSGKDKQKTPVEKNLSRSNKMQSTLSSQKLL